MQDGNDDIIVSEGSSTDILLHPFDVSVKKMSTTIRNNLFLPHSTCLITRALLSPQSCFAADELPITLSYAISYVHRLSCINQPSGNPIQRTAAKLLKVATWKRKYIAVTDATPAICRGLYCVCISLANKMYAVKFIFPSEIFRLANVNIDDLEFIPAASRKSLLSIECSVASALNWALF